MVVVSSTFAPPTVGVLLQQPSTKLMVNGQELGTATLYITEHEVVWGGGTRPSGTAAPALSLQYRTISLHAVQRDPTPSLYMVLDFELRLPELGNTGPSDEEDEEDFDVDEDAPITQLRFIPPDDNDLPAMYSAMSQGQSLHPDPADEVEDEDYMDGEEFIEGDEEFEDAEETVAQPDEAAARLKQLRLQNTNGHHPDDDDEDSDNVANN